MATPAVYLDYAATAPVHPAVLDAMMPYLTDRTFGNPSSAHRFGRAARAGVEQASQQVATVLGVSSEAIVFTSGGTEADNLAVLGAALAARDAGRPFRVAVSSVEHKAVLGASTALEHMGCEVVLLPVDEHGRVYPDALDRALERGVSLVSIMWANNETGVVQEIGDLAARSRRAGVPFHTDAVQAVGKLDCTPRSADWTMLTLSGHKLGAPKGVGALAVRDRSLIEPLLHGGTQQRGLRPGTENVAGIVALGRAVELAAAARDETAARERALRDDLERRLEEYIPDAVLHGRTVPRTPHISNVSLPGTDSEALLMHLDLAGVACSSGSACSTGTVEPSHVLTAMGVAPELAVGTLRFSLGAGSQQADVDRVIDVLPAVTNKVRQLAGLLRR